MDSEYTNTIPKKKLYDVLTVEVRGTFCEDYDARSKYRINKIERLCSC
jgi:hypothetical protein